MSKNKTLFEFNHLESGEPVLLFLPDSSDILDSNLAAELLLELDHDTLTATKFSDLSSASEKGLMQKFASLNNNESRTFRCKTQAGPELFLEIMITKVYRTSTPFIIATIKDITQFITSEKLLRRKALQFKILVDAMSEGLVVFNTTGVITYANKSFCRLLEKEADEIVGTLFFDYIQPEDHDKISLKPELNSSASVEIAFLLENNSRVHSIISPTQFVEGDQFFTMAIVTNVTMHKINETKNFHTQKLEAVGQLAAGIAHEINTPTQFTGDNIYFLNDSFADLQEALDEIKNITQSQGSINKEQLDSLLQKADYEYLSEEIPNAISQSLDGISRISKIVLSMKQFSHPEGESKSLADINSMLESTIIVCRSEWKYHCEIEKDFEETTQRIPCQQDSINQVFLNIIINAVHAIEAANAGTDEMGTIVISTKYEDDYATIQFKDSGTGIPESYLAQIFDPFFTTKEVGKGTGQGLSLAHTIIEKEHGGIITVQNNDDKGALFTIKLPATSDDF